jgi:hypothetical protein
VAKEVFDHPFSMCPGKLGRIQHDFAFAMRQRLRTVGKKQFLCLAQSIGQHTGKSLTGDLAALAQSRWQSSPGIPRSGI